MLMGWVHRMTMLGKNITRTGSLEKALELILFYYFSEEDISLTEDELRESLQNGTISEAQVIEACQVEMGDDEEQSVIHMEEDMDDGLSMSLTWKQLYSIKWNVSDAHARLLVLCMSFTLYVVSSENESRVHLNPYIEWARCMRDLSFTAYIIFIGGSKSKYIKVFP